MGEYCRAEFGPNPLVMCGRDGRILVVEVLGIVLRHDVVTVKAARSQCSTNTCTFMCVWAAVGRGWQRVGRRGGGLFIWRVIWGTPSLLFIGGGSGDPPYRREAPKKF